LSYFYTPKFRISVGFLFLYKEDYGYSRNTERGCYLQCIVQLHLLVDLCSYFTYHKTFNVNLWSYMFWQFPVTSFQVISLRYLPLTQKDWVCREGLLWQTQTGSPFCLTRWESHVDQTPYCEGMRATPRAGGDHNKKAQTEFISRVFFPKLVKQGFPKNIFPECIFPKKLGVMCKVSQ